LNNYWSEENSLAASKEFIDRRENWWNRADIKQKMTAVLMVEQKPESHIWAVVKASNSALSITSKEVKRNIGFLY